MNNIDFGRVELLRDHMLITVSNMAKLLDVSRPTYYSWVNGKQPRHHRADNVRKVIRRLLAVVEVTNWPTDQVRGATQKDRMIMLEDALNSLDKPVPEMVV